MPASKTRTSIHPPAQVYTLANKLEMHVYTAVAQLPASDWDRLAANSPFLTTYWLDVFAKAGGPNTSYLLFYRDSHALGISLLQHLPTSQMKFGAKQRASLISIIVGGTLQQFGQVLFSGAGGHAFVANECPIAVLSEARSALKQICEAGPWMIKDLDQPATLKQWHQIEALPDMSLPVRANWVTFNDYIEDLPSKYRSRARRARKLFGKLERRTMSCDDALAASDDLDALYLQLLERAEYVPYRAPVGYIAKLKCEAAGRVVLQGYYDGEQLVGFSTLLLAEQEAVAHFAAVNPDYNTEYQLYLNLLFDLLEASIDADVGTLHLGRTATTIKSSLGALPVQRFAYASHDGCLRNQMISTLRDRIQGGKPDERIQQPFK